MAKFSPNWLNFPIYQLITSHWAKPIFEQERKFGPLPPFFKIFSLSFLLPYSLSPILSFSPSLLLSAECETNPSNVPAATTKYYYTMVVQYCARGVSQQTFVEARGPEGQIVRGQLSMAPWLHVPCLMSLISSLSLICHATPKAEL